MPVMFLTEEDAELLKEVIRDRKAGRVNGASKSKQDSGYRENTDHQAPEVYAALAPAGGIPARVGTTPGSADCEIYQVSGGVLKAVYEFAQTVYNINTTSVTGATYLAVTRDKYGTWLAGPGGGGDTLRHGIVREICDQDCNTYVVEIVERTFDESCLATGTGTRTGTA